VRVHQRHAVVAGVRHRPGDEPTMAREATRNRVSPFSGVEVYQEGSGQMVNKSVIYLSLLLLRKLESSTT
jgi:hypothetical protein